MKKRNFLALLLALAMLLCLGACGGDSGEGGTSNPPGGGTSTPPGGGGGGGGDNPGGGLNVQDSEFFGPIYDEWSEMTDDELYAKALEELGSNGEINVYATSSKMLKVVDDFEEKYPGLKLNILDMDADEVLEKCRLEVDSGNVKGDVLQAKDVNGDVFFTFYEDGYCTAYYPKDICEKIDEDLLRYGYPLYTSQSFWYYNTEKYPDGQPVTNWWQIVEKNEDGSQKWALYTKEIGSETAYLSLFASFMANADQMAKAYQDLYGEPLEYTYDATGWDFDVPENNAGIEYLWRFSQLKMVFIGDGDELVEAVHNSLNGPTLALASAGKIGNRDESGFNIAWLTNLAPYTGLQNAEYLYVVADCPHPAAARLFIRWLTGGADGATKGMKPFSKEGNWPVRSDMEDNWNPATLAETGAIEPDLAAIYDNFIKAQDMWTYWLSISPNM